jgi:hypothetical protein
LYLCPSQNREEIKALLSAEGEAMECVLRRGFAAGAHRYLLRIETSAKDRMNMTLKMIAVLRMMMPGINMVAATANQTLDPQGREKAIAAGGVFGIVFFETASFFFRVSANTPDYRLSPGWRPKSSLKHLEKYDGVPNPTA